MSGSVIEGKGGIQARVVEDSISDEGIRLTTLQLRYHRFIHSEFMTHRMFCLDGDTTLTFDLPSGSKNGEYRRSYEMTIREFVEKWHEGVKDHKVSRFQEKDISKIVKEKCYTAKEISNILGYSSPSNIRKECREGRIPVENPDKSRNEDHVFTGQSFLDWYNSRGTRSFSVRSRLQNMQIRQMNEKTREIQTSTVNNCWFSGMKDVYEVVAGDFSVAGSKDHRVYTQEGWKTIGELEPGKDFIITQAFGKLEDDKKKENHLKKIDGEWKQIFNRNVKPEKIEEQDYMCYDCGSTIDINNCDIHHVVPVFEDPSLAFDKTNVIALCRECHQDRHRIQGWQGGTYLYGMPVLVEDIVYLGEKDTYDLEIAGEYPNFLANGVVVHNSRNASSSRAIPVHKSIKSVQKDPAIPISFQANQKGMQSSQDLSPNKARIARALWVGASKASVSVAKGMVQVGLHKQWANRILEPFSFIDVIVTATEWNNFFELRYHDDAQPEIYELAKCIYDALGESEPKLLKPEEWHLPYVSEKERRSNNNSILWKISSARCARVSYKNHDGTNPSISKDCRLHDFLVGSNPKHASPTEHQAKPMLFPYSKYRAFSKGETHIDKDSNRWSGNLRGWVSYRQLLEQGEL